jgi:hypothetical protein
MLCDGFMNGDDQKTGASHVGALDGRQKYFRYVAEGRQQLGVLSSTTTS